MTPYFLKIFVGVCNCFIMLCYFLLYSKVNEYTYIHSFLVSFPIQGIEQSSCAIQEVLVSYLFYIICVYGVSLVAQMVKNLPAAGDLGSICGLGRSPAGRHGNTPALLPGEFHGQRSLVGYSPWGQKESDTTGLLTQQQHYVYMSILISQFIPLPISPWGYVLFF